MKPAALFLLSLLAAPPLPALAQAPDIREWPVPWPASRPRDAFVAPDGRVWFVGQTGNYLATLDPASGDFRRFEIEPGTHPHNLIVDRDGTVWYAGNMNARIGRLDPATGQVKTYAMPDAAARDPHTLAFDGGSGIWFTVQGGNFVGHLDKGTGKVRLVPVPTPGARPYGIVVDPEGRPWLNLHGTNKLATVDPLTMQLREIALPRADARSRRIERTPDGMIWYVDYAQGMLGRYDPKSGDVKEWATPGGPRSRPYAMAVDDRARIWFVETGSQPNRLIGFDPADARFFSSSEIPSGAGAVRHMVFNASTRELWFGTDRDTIGRAKLQ